jgi:hypothetical protein
MARAAALRRSIGVLALCALLLAAPLRASASDDDGDVVVLTEKNFDAIVKPEKIIVRAALAIRGRARVRHGGVPCAGAARASAEAASDAPARRARSCALLTPPRGRALSLPAGGRVLRAVVRYVFCRAARAPAPPHPRASGKPSVAPCD